MTVEQFATLDPGFGTVMLYHSGSVVSALNIDTESCNGLNVSTAVEELEKITLNIGGELYTTDILLVVTYTGYYHLLINPVTVISTVDNFICTSTSLFPGISQVNFGKSDYQVLKNNASQARTTSFIFDVDRRTSQLIPQNYQAIISGSASPAQYQELNYSSIGIGNSRYSGAKTVQFLPTQDQINQPNFGGPDGGFPSGSYGPSYSQFGISPAVSGAPFQGASYLLTGSRDSFIFSQSLSDRDIETYLFDGSSETPISQSSIFTFEGNKILPVKERKVWVKNTLEILYVDKFGKVSRIESGSN